MCSCVLDTLLLCFEMHTTLFVKLLKLCTTCSVLIFLVYLCVYACFLDINDFAPYLYVRDNSKCYVWELHINIIPSFLNLLVMIFSGIHSFVELCVLLELLCCMCKCTFVIWKLLISCKYIKFHELLFYNVTFLDFKGPKFFE